MSFKSFIYESRSRIGVHIISLTIFVFLSVAFLYIYIKPHEISYKLQTIDSVIVTWGLSWGRHALLHCPFAYFDSNIFAFLPDSLAYTDHFFMPMLISVPFSLLSSNPILIFNLLFYLCFILNGYCMFLLALYVSRNVVAGILAGIIFAFAPIQLHHANGQLHILLSHWIPLSILYFLKYHDSRESNRRYLLTFFLFFLCAFLTGWYTAVLGTITLGVILIGHLILDIISGARYRIPRCMYAGVAMTGALIIALPFALPYFSLRENMPDNTLVGLYATHGRIAAYLFPPAGGVNITYPGMLIGNKLPYLKEIVYPQFIGYTGYLLFLAGIIFVLFTFLTSQRNKTREETYHRKRASKKMIIFLILGGIGFIFSLGPFVFKNGEFVFLPYFYVFKYFPPIRFFRGIFRFNILIILSLCLITSVLLKQVRHKTWRRLLPLALIALFIFEYFPVKAKTFHYTYNVPTAKTFYAKVKENNDIASLLELPAEAVHGQFHSIFHWKPLYNGVAGYTPFNRHSNFLTLNKVPSPKSIKLMDELNLSYVVIRRKEIKDNCMSSSYLDLIHEGNGHWLFKRTNVNPITHSERSMEASPPIEFNFTKKIDFKVSLSRVLSERTITQQGFFAKIVGNDPAMHFMLARPINGRDYNHVVVDMRITPSVKKKEVAQLFWRTKESKSFSEEDSLRFVIRSDGHFHRYTIPLIESFQWRESSNIDMIRFDPTNDCPCSLEIKSIVLSNVPEERETQQTDSH